MSDFTAESLHELVRDVPECWPEGLQYHDGAGFLLETVPAPVEEPDYSVTWYIAPTYAADLILAGVMKNLAGWCLHPTAAGWCAHDAHNYDGESAVGPTQLHAAVAAWKKVRPNPARDAALRNLTVNPAMVLPDPIDLPPGTPPDSGSGFTSVERKEP